MKYIIWDWNGTLYDDVHICVDSLNSMLKRRGKKPITIQQYREVFDFPVKQVYPRLGFNMEEEDWHKMAREYHDEYLARIHQCGLRNGMYELLRKLKTLAVPMSLVSACEISILSNLIRKTSVDEFFADVVGLSDLFANSKKGIASDLISKIKTKVPLSSILFVGDTLHDYEIASESGCQCVLIAGGHQTEKRLRSAKCPVINEIAELEEFLNGGI